MIQYKLSYLRVLNSETGEKKKATSRKKKRLLLFLFKIKNSWKGEKIFHISFRIFYYYSLFRIGFWCSVAWISSSPPPPPFPQVSSKKKGKKRTRNWWMIVCHARDRRQADKRSIVNFLTSPCFLVLTPPAPLFNFHPFSLMTVLTYHTLELFFFFLFFKLGDSVREKKWLTSYCWRNFFSFFIFRCLEFFFFFSFYLLFCVNSNRFAAWTVARPVFF